MLAIPKEQIFKDKVKNFYPLNVQNLKEVFSECDIVINTIPANVIPEEVLTLEKIPYVLDIASFPYGIDKKLVEKYKSKFEYNLYLSIPSIFAPKKASDILLKVLYDNL